MSDRKKTYVVKKTVSNNENVRSFIVVGLMNEKTTKKRKQLSKARGVCATIKNQEKLTKL